MVGSCPFIFHRCLTVYSSPGEIGVYRQAHGSAEKERVTTLKLFLRTVSLAMVVV